MIVTFQSARWRPEAIAARYVRVNTLTLPPGDFIVYECLAKRKDAFNAYGAGPTIREYVCSAAELPTEVAAAARAKRLAPWPNAVEWPL